QLGRVRQVRRDVLVLRQLLAGVARHEHVLRLRRRALLDDDKGLRVGVEHGRNALVLVVVVALEQPGLLAGLNRDAIEERLRADLVGILVVDVALQEDAGAVGRHPRDAAARRGAAAPAATAAASAAATATAAHGDERAGIGVEIRRVVFRERVLLRRILEVDGVLRFVL